MNRSNGTHADSRAAAWQRRRTLVPLLVVLVAAQAARAGDVLERPVAVVGDRVILQSELEAQLTLYAAQAGLDARDADTRAQLRDELLRQMIDDQLILLAAEKDTLIRAEPEEVEQALDDHMRSLRAQFGTDAEFERQLALENLTESELRRRYRPEVTSQLLKQRLIQRQLSSVSVSTSEVKEFHRRHGDSLPQQPRAIKLAHILLPIEPSTATVDSIRATLLHVLEKIADGMTFGDAARQYSQDATASGGGELGWFSRGEILPALENTAFRLQPGEVSGIVKSAIGYHLIECVEKASGRVHARHIVIPIAATVADTARVARQADSIRTVFVEGGDYCELARRFSSDEESQKNCGELGWYPINEMFPSFKAALEHASVGEIPPATLSDFGYHVLRILDRQDSRHLTLEDDWDTIKKLARQNKTQRKVSEWLDGIRSKTHVQVRSF